MTALRKEPAKTKNGRLELRLASQKKEILARAATVRGQSLSEFVTDSALLRARKILATEESLVLAENDRDIFFQALENPPEPSDALKKCLFPPQRIRQFKQSVSEMSYRIEALTAEHYFEQFSCGEENLDLFLKKNALPYHLKNIAKTYVILEETAPGYAQVRGAVLGFYTLSAASVLPAEVGMRWPKHPVPVALLARLALDLSQKKFGLGEILFADAAKRVVEISKITGCHALVTVAKNEAAAAFYRRFGMTPFHSHALKLFIPLETLRLALMETK